MELFTAAQEFLRIENDEYDSEPDDIGISTVDYVDDVEYEVRGRFPNESKSGEYVLPPEKRVVVERSSDFHNQIADLFEMIRENVQVRDASIRSIHISETVERDDTFDSWPFYTSDTADYRVFIGIGRENTPTDVKDELLGLLLNEIHKLDESVTANDIRNVEYLFDDMKRNFNHCLRGELSTKTPHKYYSNVSSLDEYISKLSDGPKKRAELESKKEYDVSFIEGMFADSEEIDNEMNTIPPAHIRERAEAIMENFVQETLDTKWEKMLEAESISFGDFEKAGYSHEMNYWIYVPITDGDFGVSR